MVHSKTRRAPPGDFRFDARLNSSGGQAMKTIFRHLIVAISLSLLAAPTSSAQEPDKSGKKPKEKEEKKSSNPIKSVTGVFGSKSEAEKAEKKAEKHEREYQKLLADARGKYDAKSKDYSSEFKARVDQDYKDLRRKHSEQAFRVNTFDTKDERVTLSGDKLKTEDSLYDNPLVQDYVNRVGQSLVPASSPFRYAFKVVLSPIPEARSLSTGTVYISTGLLSLIDNEAQLAYILSHEVAHTEKLHWFEDAMTANQLEDVNAKRENIRTAASVGLAAASVFTGGFGGGMSGAVNGLMYGSYAFSGISNLAKLIYPDKTFSWDRVQEDAADEYGLKLMFDRNYDPREVPKLYARLQRLSEREPRTAEGFLSQAERIGERVSYVNPMLAVYTVPAGASLMRGGVNLRALRGPEDGGLVSPLEAGKPFGTAEEAEKREKAATGKVSNLDILLKEKLDRGEIVGSAPEFQSVMADLKRDNGVRAFYYDMFQMALTNLEEALQIRSNDPYTHFYYGKVMSLTARNRAEKAKAMDAFVQAINLDKRGVLSGPWLHRALALMADRNPSLNGEVVGYLKRYVDVYQQEHGGELPPNMDAIYAYLKDLGEDRWVARPAMNISTKNIEPIETAAGARGNVNPQPATQPAATSATQPAGTKSPRKP